MPRGKAATFELQRASILQAAAELFAARGFVSASMAELAEVCGVSKPLLYHYYRDKEQILFDVADTYLDGLLAVVGEITSQRLPPLDHFRSLLRRFMQEYEHAQAYHSVLVQDVKFLNAVERKRIVAKENQVVDAFANAVAALKPRLRKKSLRVPLAMVLFGMINWTFTWLRPDGALSYDDMSEVIADIFLWGVCDRDASPIARA